MYLMTKRELIESLKNMPDDAEIEVIDLGEGMSAGTIRKVWLDGNEIIIEAGTYCD